MLRHKIANCLEKASTSLSQHEKQKRLLFRLYQESDLDQFADQLFHFLEIIFHQDVSIENPYTEKSLNFLASFCADVYKRNEDEYNPFLQRVIYDTLQYHDLSYVEARYNSCRFITLLLKYIGDDVTLDNKLCDDIQNAMLDRIQDSRMNIRLQAITALVRLQDPYNYECPVIKAYTEAIYDKKVTIRREITKNIAPNSITFAKIQERTRDVDHTVRSVAFRRCADIGPQNFTIVDRQTILNNGFHDEHAQVKQVFLEYLLPKWLTVYKGDFLTFLKAIKLDADDNDIENTTRLSKEVMQYFFTKHPIDNFINLLEIDENKLIDINKLTTDIALYLNILTNFLRSNEDFSDILERLLPELTPFCHYIESLTQMKLSEQHDQWKYLELQMILLNLFEIVEQFDLTDEVGRKTLQNLLYSCLRKYKFRLKLTNQLIKLADKCSTNIGTFTNDMCHIISDKREPETDVPLTQEMLKDLNFRMAELKVRLNILQGDKEDAIHNEDYQKAAIINNEIAICNQNIELIRTKFDEREKIRVVKEDEETICHCLDILISLLELNSTTEMSPALLTCKEEFVVPLFKTQCGEIHWRVLKCITLLCIIDKKTAEEYASVISIPIATYRAIPNYNKYALMISMSGICDLVRLYGTELFWKDNDESFIANESRKRKLYQYQNDVCSPQVLINLELFINILFDALDDECDDIKDCAINVLAKLIISEKFTVTSSFLSRLILKWYNPVTDKSFNKLQVKLGMMIEKYATLDGSRETFENAVVPTITSVVNAPRTSPLADVDIENVLQFFAALLNSKSKNGVNYSNRNYALNLYLKIGEDITNRIVPYLAKLVTYLEFSPTDSMPANELIAQATILLKDIADKTTRKYIEKLVRIVEQLNSTTESLTNLNNSSRIVNSNTTSNAASNPGNSEDISLVSLSLNETKRGRRNKQQGSSNAPSGAAILKECKVILERIQHNGSTNQLSRIQECVDGDADAMDDELTIEEFTSSSGRNSPCDTDNNTDTSSDDFRSAQCRTSCRLRNKRLRRKK